MEKVDRTINILFVIPNLSSGGSERVLINLLKTLNRKKYQPLLAVVDPRKNQLLHEVPNDVKVYRLNSSRVLFGLPKILFLIWWLRPKVVFSTLSHLNLAIGMIRLFLPPDGVYVARESSIVSEVLKQRARVRWWVGAYKAVYNSFDMIVCQSKFMQDDLVNNFKLSPKRSIVINNPININEASEKSSAPLVGLPDGIAGAPFLVAVGRLVAVKGFDSLIRAMHLCRDLNLKLLILGEGPNRNLLFNLIKSLQLEDRVFLMGYCENPYPFILKAQALILTSKYEGFPNVVLEALACGTPVVSTPAPGGVFEILEDIPGCEIVEDFSPKGIATGIRNWSTKPRQKVDRRHIEKYDSKQIILSYENLFESLSNGFKSGKAVEK